MQLVLGQEGKPVDAFLLILAKLGLDRDGNVVLLHLASIKKLCQELALLVTALEQVFWEVGWIGKARLYKSESDKSTMPVE